MILSELRENLAVKAKSLGLKHVDERAVGLVAFVADSSVEANDPELTIIRLFVTTMVEGVLSCMRKSFHCLALLRATSMPKALGAQEDVAAALR